MKSIILGTLRREMRLYCRNLGECCQPLIFFIMFVAVFALMLGKSPIELQENAIGIIWSAFVLCLILSQQSVFYTDHESGVLEQILLSPQPKILIILSKILAHSFFVGLPLVVLALISAFLFDVKSQTLWGIAVSLCLCLPSLSLLAGISSALTLSLKKGGLLLAILVLPLMAPIVLFGAGASHAASTGAPLLAHFAILLALLILLLPIAPLTCLFALETSCEN